MGGVGIVVGWLASCAALVAAELPLTAGELDGGTFERFTKGEPVEVAWRGRVGGRVGGKRQTLETSWATISRGQLPSFRKDSESLLSLPLTSVDGWSNEYLELAFSVLHGRWITDWMPVVTHKPDMEGLMQLQGLEISMYHFENTIVQLQWRPVYATAPTAPNLNDSNRYRARVTYRWGDDSVHVLSRRLRWVVFIALASLGAAFWFEYRASKGPPLTRQTPLALEKQLV